MTAQLLSSELANLIQESKRKHNDLKQASDKSLEELKNLRDSSEANIGTELSQRTNFVNPFIIACGTRNVKFTSIAIVCLQRLIAAKGVPRSRLDQVLQAIRESSSGGLDVQLRILQSLPSLLQNYAADVSGDLLITTLNICFVLQASKNVVVNNTASATLQQLLISVFDKVIAEDTASSPPAGEATLPDGTTVPLHAAALDAYHVFNDICVLTASGRAEYLRFSSLSQTFGLELIESVLTNHPSIFASHPEQTQILSSRVMPFLINGLIGKPNFPTAVRLVRVLYTVLRRHMSLLAVESGEGLATLAHVLDQETIMWKRVLCLEAFKGIFFDPSLLRQIYTLYDSQAGQKNILQDLLATFVRVSTERPTVIGLGHQSTIPVAGSGAGAGSTADQAVLEASGGIIGGSVGGEGNSTGISSQWSSIRTPCIDQLDKAEPLAIPDSYIYSLVLACITSLSEGLAKFILPLTVPGDGRGRKKTAAAASAASTGQKQDVGDTASGGGAGAGVPERSASFKKNPVPLNPLLLKEHPQHVEVQTCAEMIDSCWPAILATCSTFLYSALDSEYYHSLVRAFQRFTHVAGLLQLNTPRDAFLTTLGKAAVPPNVLTACLNAGARPLTASSIGSSGSGGGGVSDGGSLFNNARGLLSVESLVSVGGGSSGAGGSGTDKPSRQLADSNATSINTRNLLCLRALLNLGIALGPTLASSWQIILETLQQADFVLFSSGKATGRTPTVVRASDPQAEAESNQLLTNFGSEIKAVETAASRLFESTVDFPNDAFVSFVVAICGLLEKQTDDDVEEENEQMKGGQDGADRKLQSSTLPRVSQPPRASDNSPLSPTKRSVSTAGGSLKAPVVKHKRVMSINSTSSGAAGTSASVSASQASSQEDQFVLAKLGDVASINMERLLFHAPDVSGWTPIVSELTAALGSATTVAAVRMRAAETLVRLILEATAAVASVVVVEEGDKDEGGKSSSKSKTKDAKEENVRGRIQLRLLGAFRDALVPLEREDGEGSSGSGHMTSGSVHSTDLEVHKALLDGLKSLLEDSGETLVNGWNVVFEAIDSIFVKQQPQQKLKTRSVRLIKSSFASLQLICSDFLPSLPNTCYLNLVDSLYKFCSQDDDLNVALTTVTFYWTISDFLLGRNQTMSITAAMEGGPSDEALVKLASDTAHPGSGAALWMLLLLRLTAVTTDHRLELRNSAVQTLLRIIHAYGNSFNAESWAVCMRSVIFRLLSSTENMLQSTGRKGSSSSASSSTEWHETAVVIVSGVSELLGNYLEVLVPHAVFSSLWEDLLGHFATMLDFGALDISTAVFSSLASTLAKNDGSTRWSFDKKAVGLAWGLWSRGVPVSSSGEKLEKADKGDRVDMNGTNSDDEKSQKCLVSWVNAFLEIERLMRADMDLATMETMIGLLRTAMTLASPGSYSNDIEYMTPLQSQILEVCKVLRTDMPGAPSAVVFLLADFVSMAFEQPDSSRETTRLTVTTGQHPARPPRRTFVALSKASMPILHYHVTQNASDTDIFASGAFAAALGALAKPIVLKYQFPIPTRSLSPWKEAVNAALAILEIVLPHLQASTVPAAAFESAWDAVIVVANGIISADLREVALQEDAADDRGNDGGDGMIAVDQRFDLSAFRRLRELIIPALGSAAVAERTRRAYVEGVFRISMVHAPAATEAALIYGEQNEVTMPIRTLATRGGRKKVVTLNSAKDERDKLDELSRLVQRPGRGRTVDPPPTKRADMSYACLDELFALVTAQADAGKTAPSIVVQPPTPRFGRTMTMGPAGPRAGRDTLVAEGDGNAEAGGEAGRKKAGEAATEKQIEKDHALRVRLAQTAAPFLLLRCALTLRSYVADQPLRGHMPQPLSQRRELWRVLRHLVGLQVEPLAIPDLEAADSDDRKHLLRLYPLLVQTTQTAGRMGDSKTLALSGEALEVVGTELGVGGGRG